MLHRPHPPVVVQVVGEQRDHAGGRLVGTDHLGQRRVQALRDGQLASQEVLGHPFIPVRQFNSISVMQLTPFNPSKPKVAKNGLTILVIK